METPKNVDKYSLFNRDNLTQPTKTKLSQSKKRFSHFFSPFSKFKLKFKSFQKKNETNS